MQIGTGFPDNPQNNLFQQQGNFFSNPALYPEANMMPIGQPQVHPLYMPPHQGLPPGNSNFGIPGGMHIPTDTSIPQNTFGSNPNIHQSPYFGQASNNQFQLPPTASHTHN